MAGKNIYVLDHAFVSSLFQWDWDVKAEKDELVERLKAENGQLKARNQTLEAHNLELRSNVVNMEDEFWIGHKEALESGRISRGENFQQPLQKQEELLDMYKQIVNVLQANITARKRKIEQATPKV